MPTDYRLRLPALVEYRAQSRKRRAEAFCDAPESVIGVDVLPLCPATYSMLVATGNAFVMGGRVREADVRNFLWFHSPLYSHAGVAGWPQRKAKALRVLDRAARHIVARKGKESTPGHLLPRRRVLALLFRCLGLQYDADHYAAALALATVDIKRIVADAFADSPEPLADDRPPVATLEAQFVAHFAKNFAWAPERTSRTPLARLFQILRSIDPDPRPDRGEQAILFAHLKAKNDALAKERAEH